MVLSNSTSEPDERTTLLNGNKSNDPSLGDAIKPVEYGNADRDASKNGVEDSGDVDEEAGGAADFLPEEEYSCDIISRRLVTGFCSRR